MRLCLDQLRSARHEREQRGLLETVEALRAIGAVLIAVTGRPDSSLGRQADVVLEAGVSSEGGPLGLAPRASIAVEALVLAALSAELEDVRGLSREQYARWHPAGELGRRARER